MRRHALLGSVVFASALFFAATSPAGAAAIVTQPPSLAPGTQYRLAFVTSTTRNATSSNIADYNNFINAAVNSSPGLVALGATWTALVSTSAISARDNTGTNPFGGNNPGVGIWALNGNFIAGGNFPLWNTFATPNVINANEFGTTITDTVVWTGTTRFGSRSSGREMGASVVQTGTTGGVGTRRFGNSFSRPSDLNPLYGISSILTIPAVSAPAAVPEPNSFILLSIGAFCLVGGGIRRRKRANKSS